MSTHSENQHRESQHKIAELSIQETASIRGAEGYTPDKDKAKPRPA
jgi:hypothetical protein